MKISGHAFWSFGTRGIHPPSENMSPLPRGAALPLQGGASPPPPTEVALPDGNWLKNLAWFPSIKVKKIETWPHDFFTISGDQTWQFVHNSHHHFISMFSMFSMLPLAFTNFHELIHVFPAFWASASSARSISSTISSTSSASGSQRLLGSKGSLWRTTYPAWDLHTKSIKKLLKMAIEIDEIVKCPIKNDDVP